MNILLTNDDGILAPGIAAVYKELVKLGDVTVVAPADRMSGAGHSITVYEPLVCEKLKIEDQFSGYSVSGSPADCVKLAIMELCPKKPDLVVSGINNGANVGINVYYSGTVAAAMEAAFYKIPAIALSAAHEEQTDFKNAAKHCVKVIEKLLPASFGGVLNINIPQLSKGEPKGIKVVPQSTMGFDEHFAKKQSDTGQTLYQLTGGNHRDKDLPSDTVALNEGFITVTALGFDMTDYNGMKKLHQIKW
ncbi:MAG: 5'/3'-nucleotidase SurE [Planctomycetes bacterium]|nr:5'/3'-nucleotidase SurE [Planctomycetota bacterium]MBU1518259.1 5'/3'-nucleotidase SurE [Planctomycetota bacterium]MBU2457026.1 5'/3'-nucleotidase SurE [Planctomycetota bacterium]MBU2596431.1 5'/3'-nucleotidase SurE [Planctomycetota bacterium]